MRTLLGAACIVSSLLAVAQARASEEADIAEAITTIRAFIDAPTREEWAAYCTADAVLVDHAHPYVFQGPTACADQWDAMIAWTTQNRFEVTNWGSIGEPDFVDASANQVYAVFSAKAEGKRAGVPEVERGIWTFVVRREAKGWRIAGYSWSTLEFAPAEAPTAPQP